VVEGRQLVLTSEPGEVTGVPVAGTHILALKLRCSVLWGEGKKHRLAKQYIQ